MPTVIPYIPQTITVHLGQPSSNAQNVTVSFADYIKNVASSEIYPTWNTEAIYANIYAQISFALNKIYTEYYPSRGYDFEITSSTAYDQKFIYGRTIFRNISEIVDEIFDDYIRRKGTVEPLAAKYCNGTTVTCNGLSQWGSEYMARGGANYISILKAYYGNDIELVVNAPIRSVRRSYPGYAIRRGDSGENVTVIQVELNRISNNYPAIPKITPVDGVFGAQTEEAVKKFQSIFNLTPDGIVGKATWYKLVSIYVGITKLTELESEGQKYYGISFSYPNVLRHGDSGEKVEILQYMLSVISNFNPFVKNLSIDGIFGDKTRDSVVSFQKQYGLQSDGIVGEMTWNRIYDAFIGTEADYAANEGIFDADIPPTPEKTLKTGDRGEYVMLIQTYLDAVSFLNVSLPPVAIDGIYGEKTAMSVRAYQAAYGLDQTGEVNFETWQSLTNSYRNIRSARRGNVRQFPGYDMSYGDIDGGVM